MDKKAIAAMILGCKPQELMSYKDFGAFVSVVDPVGRKFVYTNEHLQDAAQRSELAATKNVATAKKDAAPPAPDPKKIAKPPAKKSEPGDQVNDLYGIFTTEPTIRETKKPAKPPAKKSEPGGPAAAKKIATTKPTTKGRERARK